MTESARLTWVYLGSLLLLAAYPHAPTAYAAPGDPPRGSPAGAVYQLPLEQGRSDAAPRQGGGSSPGAGGSDGSLYRTENNFGSSSQVPGSTGAGAAAAGGAGGGGAGGGAGDGASDTQDGPGGGGAREDGGPADGAPDAVEAGVADSGNTSVAAGAALLAALGVLALAAGVLSRRFSQR